MFPFKSSQSNRKISPAAGFSRGAKLPETWSDSSITTSSTSAGPDGDPEAGEPIQYDELRIEHDEGALEIVVYTGSPAAKRAPPPRAALFRS